MHFIDVKNDILSAGPCAEMSYQVIRAYLQFIKKRDSNTSDIFFNLIFSKVKLSVLEFASYYLIKPMQI